MAAWGSQPWAPASAPAQKRPRAVLAAVLGGIFAVGLGAGVIGARVTAPSSSPSTASVTPAVSASGGSSSSSSGSSGASSGSGGSNAAGSSGSGNSSDSSTSSGSTSTSAIASKVTPGVVDVTVSVSGGGTAAGTGMVITSSGEVLTNNHVIADATSITVQIAGTGPTYKAHVVGYDVTDDIALLQIDGASHLTTVTIGSSSNLTVGEAVVTLGNALGRSGVPAVTSGSITALDQTITASDQGGANPETLSGLIEINARIQAGDSGGPLVDSSGTVIGVDTAAQVSNARFDQQASTVAYAIPIDAAMTIVKQIESGKGSATVHIGQTRALLGVSTQDIQSGAQVSTVENGSPAATAGIVAGDIITLLDGTAIDSQATLRTTILRHEAGDKVRVSWIDSAGATHTATVTLASGPPA